MAVAAIGTARVDLIARTGPFSASMKRATGDVHRFGTRLGAATATTQAMTAAASRLGVVIGTALSARSLYRAAEGAEEFNQAMASSLAIMNDVSGAMRTKMVNATIEVSNKTKFSAKEAAGAYYYLASAGLDAEQSLSAIVPVATFAQAGMFDLSRATSLLSGGQKALGLSSKNATQNLRELVHVGDVLVKANTLADATVEQFSEALTNKFGAALRTSNKTLEEGVAVLAAYADQQIKGAEAGTQASIVFRELKRKAIEFSDAFKKSGVKVFDNGEMRKTWDIIRDIERETAKLSTKGKEQFLMGLGIPSKSVDSLRQLIGTSSQMEDFYRSLMNAGGTMQSVADKQLPAFTKAMNKAASALDAFKAVIIGPALEGWGMALLGVKGSTQEITAAMYGLKKGIQDVNAAILDAASSMLKLTSYILPFFAGGSKAKFYSTVFGQLAGVTRKGAQLQYEQDMRNLFPATQPIARGAAGGEQKPIIAEIDPDAWRQAMKGDISAGASIAKQLRTPIEIFHDTVVDLRKHVLLGTIDKTTEARGIKAAQLALAGAYQAPGGIDAIERGTQAHYAAESRARRNDTNRRYLANLVRETLNQTSIMREAVRLLKERNKKEEEERL